MLMYELRVGDAARLEFESLPLRMQARVQEVFVRLVRWPDVSGVKALRGSLKGAYRIRTGDWRVLFTVDEGAGRVTVFRIANRRDVYDD
jgi:mRNA interferase RelE/StbE